MDRGGTHETETLIATSHFSVFSTKYVYAVIKYTLFQGIDTAYFTSIGKDGSVFVLRIARRHERKAELWLSIKVNY